MYAFVSIPSLILSLMLAVYYLVSMAAVTIGDLQKTSDVHAKVVASRHSSLRSNTTFNYSTDHLRQAHSTNVAIKAGVSTPWYLSASLFWSNYSPVGIQFPPVFLQPASIHCATLFSRPPPYISLLQA